MTFSKSLYAAVLLALALAAARAQTPRPGRDARAPASDPPAVSLKPSASRVVFASDCYENRPPEPACKATSALVRFNAAATNVGDAPVYTYTTNGGEIKGDGPNATLDLTGVAPGTYTVTVEVDAGRGPFASDSATVTAERCNCPLPPPPPCPSVTVSCPDTPGPGGALTFTAHVSGGDTNATPKFNWTVSAGAIKSGQGASSITVDTGGARP